MTPAQRRVLEAMARGLTPDGVHMPTRYGRPWVCGESWRTTMRTVEALVALGFIKAATGGQCREDGCHTITPAGRAALARGGKGKP